MFRAWCQHQVGLLFVAVLGTSQNSTSLVPVQMWNNQRLQWPGDGTARWGAWHGIPVCCVPLQGLSSSSEQGHEQSSAQGAAEPSRFSSPSDTNCTADSSPVMVLDLIFLITELLMKKVNQSLRTTLALKLMKCKTGSLGLIVLFDWFYHLLSLAVWGNRVPVF